MKEVHDRFDAWLIANGDAELPRDVAMHAAGCERCMDRAAAIDALLAVDVGAAAAPLWESVERDGHPVMARIVAAGAVGALAVAVAVAAVTHGPFGPDAELGRSIPSPIGEGVLGGAGRPSMTQAASPSPSPSPTSSLETPTPTAEPTPSEPSVIIVAPAPTLAPPPLPTPPPTPVPTATPSPTPAVTPSPTPLPTPSPTPVPTPPVSPTPTPEPTPNPTPDPTPGAP